MSKLSIHNNSKLRIANNAKEWVCPSVAVGQDIIVGTQSGYVYRLAPDGNQVWSSYISDSPISSVIIDSLNNIIIGNGFVCFVVNLSGEMLFFYNIGYDINCLAMQSDGKILVGYNAGILRLNTDYSVDGSFICPLTISVTSILVDSLYFYAGTIEYSGNNTLWKFNSNGVIQIEFIYNEAINCIALQSDGKILAGTALGVYRFNIDGSLDTSYATISQVSSLLVKNTEIWVGILNDNLFILDYDLTMIDNPTSISNQYTLMEQNDSKVLVGGNTGIIRHNADYSIDTLFTSTITSQVNAIALINN